MEGPPPVSPDPISLLSDTRRPTIRISGVEGPPPVSPDPISLLKRPSGFSGEVITANRPEVSRALRN
jgi:hypothetical protein